MYRLKTIFRLVDPEAILWTAALAYLFFINPYEVQEFTFCPFHNIGIDNCPGCGLGRSISFFYHGDLTRSLNTHLFGIPAFLIISARIIQLTRKKINNLQQSKEAQYGKRIRTNA